MKSIQRKQPNTYLTVRVGLNYRTVTFDVLSWFVELQILTEFKPFVGAVGFEHKFAFTSICMLLCRAFDDFLKFALCIHTHTLSIKFVVIFITNEFNVQT